MCTNTFVTLYSFYKEEKSKEIEVGRKRNKQICPLFFLVLGTKTRASTTKLQL